MPQLRKRAHLVAAATLQWMFSAWRAPIVAMGTPNEREPIAALVARLAEIQGMKTGALRDELTRLTDSPAKSWNRPYLVRKVSWLTQAASRQTSDGVRDLTLVEEVRDQPRSGRLDARIMAMAAPVRDPRLPKPGTVIVRPYRGLRLVVTVLERGFEWNGRYFPSLSAVACAVTGCHWNGRLFFGLTRRSRGRK